jgi:hydroperoxide lyase
MLPSFSPAATAAATPPRHIPGGYGIPVLGPLRDRLDYFWFQGPEEFFRRRAAQHRSTVFRANIPPTFPFFLGVDPRVVAIVDTAAFTALFDNTLVDKRDCLIGPYNPSDSFTGGTRVGVYLDTEEPEHARTKAYSMDLLRRSSRVWAPEFLAGVDTMLTAVESDLAAGKEGGASFLVPLQQCIFRFLCKAVTGADPAAESLVDRFGFYILDVWLGLQLVPTQKIGAIPQPLEELLLHSFPFPSIIVKPG